MKLSEILRGVEYSLSLLCADVEIMHLSFSNEECDKKTLMIVSNSKRANTSEADYSEARCVMCDSELEIPKNIPRITVKNIRVAIAFAFSNFYSPDYSKMKIIGITGTNGKTSTAAFIERILSESGEKVGFIGTGRISADGEILSDEYYSMTTPDPQKLYRSLKQMESAGCTYVVMEVSSHALALHKVDAIPFEYAVMTNISSEHLDFHGSREEYFKAKCRLLSMCKTAVFNIDDTYIRSAFSNFSGRKISVGALFRADVFATDIEQHGFFGVDYLYHGKSFTFLARLKVSGIYNVYNSMLAAALATDIGIEPYRVKNAINSLETIEGRFEIIKDDLTVIIDYAHTDHALECVLKSISEGKECGELTVLFGAGGERDREKRPRMASVAERYADRVIVTEDNSRGEPPEQILEDIVKGFRKKTYRTVPDRRAAVRYAILSARRGDTVAIIGKGCEKYNIDKKGYHSFDEKEIIKQALRERKNNENKT